MEECMRLNKDDRVIFHIDMNNFYASVECLINPSLKNYAVAVAGDPNKRSGIILAKNYIAKAFGIKTAEVIWQAKQKCPTLVCVAPHFEEYEKYSKLAHDIYYKYTDKIEPFGIDECWLDITDSLKLFDCTPEELAPKIQKQIKDELGLSVSIGISFGKTLAKLGSDMKKPMGLIVIDRDNHLDILKRLKVDDMIMIGKHTSQKLREMNILSLYDLYSQREDFLVEKFGIVGKYLLNAVSGIDDDTIYSPNDEDVKSVGNGETAPRDLLDLDDISKWLHDLSSRVSYRLREKGMSAKTIHLSIKYADFTYSGAQSTKTYYFSNENDIYEFSFEIFKSLAGSKFPPVRALRISATNLIKHDEDRQVNLFTNNKQENLCKAIDLIKHKFGNNIISLGSDTQNK